MGTESAGREQLVAWCERIASYFAQHGGLPPITGRALGWLMVCDPPAQSAGEIAEAIGASRASLTATLRLLQAGGLIAPVTRAGGRATYFQLVDDVWATALRRRFDGLTAFRTIARDGIELLGAESPRAARVQAAHEVYGWLAEEIDPLWQRWDTRKQQEGTA